MRTKKAHRDNDTGGCWHCTFCVDSTQLLIRTSRSMLWHFLVLVYCCPFARFLYVLRSRSNPKTASPVSTLIGDKAHL